MDEINQDTGKYCFGINDTIYALESGAIDKLLCYQDLELYRVKVKNNINEEETKFLSIDTRNTLNLNEFERESIILMISSSVSFVSTFSSLCELKTI